MPKIIEVVSKPNALDVPQEILTGLIGLMLEAEGPVTIPTNLLTNSKLRRYDAEKVYMVPTESFLRAVKGKNRKAWEWFVINTDTLIVCIEVEVCEER